MKRIYIYIVGALAILIIGIYFIRSKQSPIAVDLVEIQQVEVESTISASGIVKSENQANLAFSASGKITYLGPQKGTQVSKGQLLAQIYAFPQAKSSQSAKDSRDIAIRNKEAYIDTYADASSDFHNSDEYKIQIRKYDELISQAESSYQSIVGSLDNLKIRSAFAGTILNVTKDVGEIASAGETIYEITDLSKKYFEVAIDQEDFGKIKIDQQAHISLDAHADEVFEGKVYELPNSAETGSTNNGSFVIKIKVEDKANNELPILIGMTGDVDVVIQKSEGVVTAIPFDAIYTDTDGSNYVWTLVSGNIIRKKNIKIGVEGNLYTEVIGLDSLTQVITSADSKIELLDGKPGKITNQ
ncbi:hypothetical protein CO058_03110 [candidate division WWE3 bacterium CG_4_9_14_0_2_um_filter_35_11]|uniref:Uncharacterized protein n=1 Tax=candidate division WWE3 bacterium CG_4_9_14_0_2_um_filter_35_11 TaxID=1975077 RepID=A0A2M8ELA0_UNCKA|nr:MAG: hypothetical protein COV25_03600 [candidate division WWE3 bacterium CG10_big_fil_rev_8_21_14_0_10_35_32]PJC23477.1 MAG: hypothetical protein CO058_03110 [candidate division WWE3 bacterium CG_4_9_14_0_2_um_filter_35_11]